MREIDSSASAGGSGAVDFGADTTVGVTGGSHEEVGFAVTTISSKAIHDNPQGSSDPAAAEDGSLPEGQGTGAVFGQGEGDGGQLEGGNASKVDELRADAQVYRAEAREFLEEAEELADEADDLRDEADDLHDEAQELKKEGDTKEAEVLLGKSSRLEEKADSLEDKSERREDKAERRLEQAESAERRADRLETRSASTSSESAGDSTAESSDASGTSSEPPTDPSPSAGDQKSDVSSSSQPSTGREPTVVDEYEAENAPRIEESAQKTNDVFNGAVNGKTNESSQPSTGQETTVVDEYEAENAPRIEESGRKTNDVFNNAVNGKTNESSQPSTGQESTVVDEYEQENAPRIEESRQKTNDVFNNAVNGKTNESSQPSTGQEPTVVDEYEEENAARMENSREMVNDVFYNATGGQPSEGVQDTGQREGSGNSVVDQWLADNEARIASSRAQMDEVMAPFKPEPALDATGSFTTKGGAVSIDLLPSESANTNELYYSTDGWKTKHLVGTNKETGTVELGTFKPGTRIEFAIETGRDTFKSGDASNNADGVVHAKATKDETGTRIAFEDQRGGGDKDYNDSVFRVREAPREQVSTGNAKIDQWRAETEARIAESSARIKKLFHSAASEPAPLDPNGSFTTTGGKVSVDLMESNAGFNNKLYYSTDGWKTKQLVGSNKESGSVELGIFAPGTRIEFGIATPEGNFFKSGDASQNADSRVHARATEDDAGTRIGFEDLSGGGDNDYDDAVFRVRES